MEDVVNIAAYKFIELPDVGSLRAPIKSFCDAQSLKGTVLLAPEGINLFLAGSREAVDSTLQFLREDRLFEERLADLTVKESRSKNQPFRRMLVRLKREIVTMRHPTIRPQQARAAVVAPKTLRQWLDRGTDDAGREVILLDTRNAFEVDVGTFEDAHHLSIDRFGEFPHAVKSWVQKTEQLADKTIVTFCTGGIRCEKATLYMEETQLGNVVQLDGGILRYFEEVGADHWRGDCFVFDDRVAVDPRLRETQTVQCYACRSVVTVTEQSDPSYVRGESCPHCFKSSPESNSLHA